MSKTDQKKQRKSMKGVPRVTDKILALSPDEQAKWLDESCKALSPEIKAEVKARLEKANAEGRKPKKVNFGTIFKGRTVEELTDAQTALTAALAEAAATEEAEAEAELARIQAKIDAMKTAREKASQSAPAPVEA